MELFWTSYWTFVSFVFGAIVGSFLNVCIWRLPRQESLWDPPSHCPACEHRLRFFPDMVPMLSQLWRRSRCRYCGTRFSWRYFWVELLTAALFAAIYVRCVVFGLDPALDETERTWIAMAGMAFAAALVTIFFIDLENYTIPDLAIFVALGAALTKDLVLIFTHHRGLSEPVLGTIPVPLSILGAAVGFWLLWQFSALASAILGKEAMGEGDSLLLAAMAAFLIPWPLVVFAFMLAVVLGTIGGVAGILMSRPAPEPAAATAGEHAAAVTEEEPAPAAYPSVAVSELAHAGRAGAAMEGNGPGGDAAAVLCEPAGAAAEMIPDDEYAHPEEVHTPAVDDDDDPPPLPTASRWGRVWTVAGSWLLVGAVWSGAALARRESLPLGLAAGLVGLALGAALMRFGTRLWKEGDAPWEPVMEEYMEDDPGPRVIPFGPYLVTGTLAAMLIGYPIIQWYLNTIGLSSLVKGGWD